MRPKVLVLGDMIVDEYIYGECYRISPEAPVPVVVEKSRVRVPGGAGNVAENLKSLGAEVKLWCDEKVSHKLRIVVGQQQIVRLDNDNLSEMYVPSALGDWVAWADSVIISDYNKGVVTEDLIWKTNAECRKFNKPLLVDPYNGKYQYGDNVSLIKPNKQEMQSVTGITIKDKQSLIDSGYVYLEMSKAKSVVVTLGQDGMALFDHKYHVSNPYISKVEQRPVFDVTGAGDTAIAVMAHIMATAEGGLPSKQLMVDLANVAAGLVVEKKGTATITRDELQNAYMIWEYHERT